MNTIQEGKDYLAKNAADGVQCPCCTQVVKLYKRKLNANMAAFLIHLVRLSGSSLSWVDYRKIPFRGRDYNYLAHWGLAATELAGAANTQKRTSGLWRPTTKGVGFVTKRLRVPSHVYIYNNKALKFELAQVSIIEALGDRFDYQQLMQPAA